MRYQGKIIAWHDDKGYGFVTRNGDDGKVFLHVSALPRRHTRRPQVGDLLTWAEGKDGRGRLQAIDALFVGDEPAARIHRRNEHTGGAGWLARVVACVAVLALIAVAWQRFDLVMEDHARNVTVPKPETRGAFGENAQINRAEDRSRTQPDFRCEPGKIHCSQMRSCAEATQYLRHCPNMEMDGDGDGIPCESQHCLR